MAQEFQMDPDDHEIHMKNNISNELSDFPKTPQYEQFEPYDDIPFEFDENFDNDLTTTTSSATNNNQNYLDDLVQSASKLHDLNLDHINGSPHDMYPSFHGFASGSVDDYLAIRSKLATPQPNSKIRPILSHHISKLNTLTSASEKDEEQKNGRQVQEEEYIPPENFSPVTSTIYRSSFPRPENFNFLKTIGLKSIIILIPEEYPTENLEFVKENNITIFQVGLSGNKEPFVNVPDADITKALTIALNPANHPLLIHCNRGKHRTGCLVGCIRRLQDWSLTMISDEYRRFAAPKARPLDQQFIELYDDTEIRELAAKNKWLPLEW